MKPHTLNEPREGIDWSLWAPLSAVAIGVVVGAVRIAIAAMTPNAPAKYAVGQMVKTVIGGHVGQVIGARCNERACWYDVRFNALQLRTDTFAPLAEVRGMREIELRGAQ